MRGLIQKQVRFSVSCHRLSKNHLEAEDWDGQSLCFIPVCVLGGLGLGFPWVSVAPWTPQQSCPKGWHPWAPDVDSSCVPASHTLCFLRWVRFLAPIYQRPKWDSEWLSNFFRGTQQVNGATGLFCPQGGTEALLHGLRQPIQSPCITRSRWGCETPKP